MSLPPNISEDFRWDNGWKPVMSLTRSHDADFAGDPMHVRKIWEQLWNTCLPPSWPCML